MYVITKAFEGTTCFTDGKWVKDLEQYDSLSWFYEVLHAGYNKEELGLLT